ncbi:MAG TPA: hypothetical protein VG308_01625 [Stellaceae bacterium]|jgi:hypothetical protein|nr:hypothetical protein [Stellaceae bacterium]
MVATMPGTSGSFGSKFLCRHHRHQPAFAVPKDPETFGALLVADGFGSCVHIAGISGDRHVIGVGIAAWLE